jgi:myo-inositol-1(or 4)-monophosphatase
MLDTATAAARAAGEIIRSASAQVRQAQRKGFRDLVTGADLAAQEAIVRIIRERYPDHGFLGEEDLSSALDSPYNWIIDPLDGTTNYARGLPLYSTSIALYERGQPLLGVVYDPARDQLFSAERNKGAYLSSPGHPPQPLRVSSTTDLGEALVNFDWSREESTRAATLERVNRVAHRVMTLRTMGSAALSMAYLAAGWLDVYCHPNLSPWDVAAAAVLITEAGGRISTLDGSPWQVDKPHCLATNGHLHDLVWPLVRLEGGIIR